MLNNHPYLKDFANWKDQFQGFFGDDFWKNFDGMFQNQLTQYNLYQGENELLCVVNIPGINKLDDIDLFVNQHVLEIEGKINLNYKGFKLIQEGIFQGNFKRNIELPYIVRDDRIEASYQQGLLIIHLHKQFPADGKKNKVAIKSVDE
ncbi:HSP20 family molecular chaperone IbpA [Bacillus mesophilus]|uniref:Hsp20/alpha crystallin family protein n=1 Tax=Bacillus mesophilus TaxID=1808955 RepID=A0A6M0QCA2_9BACI|nr:Hsp20/alpha crystallin family protein [Bacillus mesophilus]MBM7662780.1 HSP20 family molecular chaperone IbpA [Bacillus mesophilus]NEY73160.1 Hsp20/alpha crystallin family protein [Bacillus mesophilus]